jgi:subtilisin family serine protease
VLLLLLLLLKTKKKESKDVRVLLMRKMKSRRQSHVRVGTWPRDDSYRRDCNAVGDVVDGGYAGSGCDGYGGADAEYGAGGCDGDMEDVHMHQMHYHLLAAGNVVDVTVVDVVGSLAGREEEEEV